jgi:uncharacterized membrane protein YeaQ/YmgE (transglycosylase-associated protein family)
MGFVLWTIVIGLFAGIVIGPLARLVLPGKQNISLPVTVAIGAIGGIGGGFVARALGVGNTDGPDWIQLIIQIVIAATGIVAYERWSAKDA